MTYDDNNIFAKILRGEILVPFWYTPATVMQPLCPRPNPWWHWNFSPFFHGDIGYYVGDFLRANWSFFYEMEGNKFSNFTAQGTA